MPAPLVMFNIRMLILIIYIMVYSIALGVLVLLNRALSGVYISVKARMWCWRISIITLLLMIPCFWPGNYYWHNIRLNLPSDIFTSNINVTFDTQVDYYNSSGASIIKEVFLRVEYIPEIAKQYPVEYMFNVTKWIIYVVPVYFGVALFLIILHFTSYCLYKRKLLHFPHISDKHIETLLFNERAYLNIVRDVPYSLLIGTGRQQTIAPCVIGFIKPRIVVSNNTWRVFSSDEKEAVIAHEMFHVLMKDNIRNFFFFFLQDLFWFNPLYRYVFRMLRCDLEFLRDKQIIDMYKTDKAKKAYCRAILSVVKESGIRKKVSYDSRMLNTSGVSFRIHLLNESKDRIGISFVAVFVMVLFSVYIICYGGFHPIIQYLYY